MPDAAKARDEPVPVLARDEYVEQAYFFRIFRERLDENLASQDILADIHEELLASTKLPIAIEFLQGEMLHSGRLSDGMRRLAHYFTPFQTFLMAKAEEDRSRFDQKIALEALQREAEFRAEHGTPAGLFVYQFECIARNRLGYDHGLTAMAADPVYSEPWRQWIKKLRVQVGTVDFADMIYYRSEHYVKERLRKTGTTDDETNLRERVLFGESEGRIAKANRGKDPLYLFAALQRHLGYPAVPRPKREHSGSLIHPAVEARIHQLEKRLLLLEAELAGKLDLSQFMVKPPEQVDLD